MDEQPKIPESFVQAVFENGDSILYNLQIGARTRPIQILAIAEHLRIIGEAGIVQEQMEKLRESEMKKIEVPKGSFNR